MWDAGYFDVTPMLQKCCGGLGVYQIAAALFQASLPAGQITASNAPEGGAVFTVRLPTNVLVDQHSTEVPS